MYARVLKCLRVSKRYRLQTRIGHLRELLVLMLVEVERDIELREKCANLFFELCIAACECNGTIFKILGVALLFL